MEQNELTFNDLPQVIAQLRNEVMGMKRLLIKQQEENRKHHVRESRHKPMTVEEADKQNANPKYTEMYIPDPNGRYMDRITGERLGLNPDYDERYSVNCQTCAPAYALRLRGFDVTAKGKTDGSKLAYLANGRAFEVWKNIDGTPAQHTSINSWLIAKGYQKMTPKRYWQFFNEVCREEGVY